MGSYYYAIASLPFLEFTSDLLPDPEDIFSLVAICGSAEDARIIRRAKIEPDFIHPADPLLKRFWRWENGLRNELARQRAQTLNKEVLVHRDDAGSDGTAVAGLSDALKVVMQSDSPLEADEGLDRLRWSYLDELEIGQFFNLQQMIIYYLRLQILHRRRMLIADGGKKHYEAHYKIIYQQYQNGAQA